MTDNIYRKFKYRSLCHRHDAKMYSDKYLVVGELYEVHLWDNGHSSEYEIFKKDVYQTSFLISTRGILDKFEDFFYTEEQMRDIKIEGILN